MRLLQFHNYFFLLLLHLLSILLPCFSLSLPKVPLFIPIFPFLTPKISFLVPMLSFFIPKVLFLRPDLLFLVPKGFLIVHPFVNLVYFCLKRCFELLFLVVKGRNKLFQIPYFFLQLFISVLQQLQTHCNGLQLKKIAVFCNIKLFYLELILLNDFYLLNILL